MVLSRQTLHQSTRSMLLGMGVTQVQQVSGLLKHWNLSTEALPADSQDLHYRARETSFQAKKQAVLPSPRGYLYSLQAYSFGCATTHISREAAGHSSSRGKTLVVGGLPPPATAGPPPPTCTQELTLITAHREHLPAAPLPSPPGSSWQLPLCQA